MAYRLPIQRIFPTPSAKPTTTSVQFCASNQVNDSFSSQIDTPATFENTAYLGHNFGQVHVLPHSLLSVQRQASGSSDADEPDSETDLARRIEVASTGGASLPSGIRETLENTLGASLSQVRIHTDTEADHLSRSVRAHAFTTQQDIFFRAGTYNPDSPQGLHLLAHEVAHTVQQASGPVDGQAAAGGVMISDPGDRFEQAADQVADTVIAGLANESASGNGIAIATPADKAVQREDEI